MSDAADQPDWSLLPHDPKQFFGLGEGFDRKDLKRAYNRLIRVFKPERHPAEFQKIRAAYEDLDRALRYGSGIEGVATMADALAADVWSFGDASSDAGASATEAGVTDEAAPAPTPLHERVTSESHPALYRELKDKADKTPYEYYALALLSDVCDRKDGLQFARWILAGIKACPDDFALPRLLQAFLRGPVAAEELPKLLVASAKAIGRDAFYPVTEPGWDALLRTGTLELFVDTLQKCEPHLRDIGIGGKMAFTIRALRVAFWKNTATPAAAAWVDAAMDFVESNFEQIPPELEFEVDLLSLAQDYLKVRRRFAESDDLRRRLDRALETYFTSDQVDGDRAIVELQLELAHNPETLLRAFPAGAEDESLEGFYPLWSWIGYEVADRCGDDDPEAPDYELWSRRCHAMLVQAEAKCDGSSMGQAWNWSGVLLQLSKGLLYVLVFSLVFSPLLTIGFGLVDEAEAVAVGVVLVAVVAGVAAAFFAGRWLASQVNERIYYPFCAWMATRCYRRLWRRDALGLLGRSRLPFNVFRDLVAHQASNQISTSIWVSNHIGQDYALALYAMALRHVV